MKIAISEIDVTLDTFNKYREFMLKDGEAIPNPVTSEDLDASGVLEIPCLDGDIISVHMFYARED